MDALPAASLLDHHRHPSMMRCLLGTLGLVVVAACGSGGDGNGNPGTGGPSAPVSPVVFIAMASPSGPSELFLSDAGAPGTAVKVNPPLVDQGRVGPYALSPDLGKAAYLAFQESITVEGLYLVDLATPGTSIRVNPALPENRRFDEFAFSPDGSAIAYLADQDVAGRVELYLAHVANPGVATRLGSALQPGGDVTTGIGFSPDGTKILYAADLDVDNRFELYLVDLANPAMSTKVNGPLVDGGNLFTGFAFSPDGKWIAYIADQEVDGVPELYLVATAVPGTAAKLNAPLVAGGGLCSFRFSPDSARVAYCADQEVDGRVELYLVEVAQPGVATKLNAPLVDGGDISAQSYRFAPDGRFVVYHADQDTNNVFELYGVDVANPGAAYRINSPLIAAGDVAPAQRTPSFRISADGRHVRYIADQETDETFELYTVDLANPGVSVKLSAPVTVPGVAQLEQTADGEHIVYHGFQVGGVPELYRVAPGSPGVSTRLNGELPAGGGIIDFSMAPGLRIP